MKSKLLLTFFINFFLFTASTVLGQDQFNFDVTEVEITENGNKFKGIKRGTIKTSDGIIINADEFDYHKVKNILNAKGKVQVFDQLNNYIIYSDKITYFKNNEIIFSSGNSKAISDNIIIEANRFEYNKNLNIITANDNVKIDDIKEDVIIFSQNIKYKKNDEYIITKGFTESKIKKKYDFYSKNVFLDRNKMELSSKNPTQVLDGDFNLYELDEFKYFKNNNLLKGKNIKITSNFNTINESDEFFFEDGIFNLENKNFDAAKTEISMQKGLFANLENDPRLIGISSFKKNNITQINKGVFTSCKKTDKCPPWSIQAQKIKHNKNRKQLIYENALLKIYDFPVVYFPKFFHPDPTVERQSGILVPILNESQILGSSLQIPYFKVLSRNSDITFRPNIFDSNVFLLQSEYRSKKEYSSLLADFGFTKGYKSSISNKKKNISHLFAKYKLDLNLDNFISSNLNLQLEKVTNDTYLKIFDGNLSETNINIKPNKDKLTSSLNLSFEHENFNFSTGLTGYEKLTGKNSDRYQYILPYYNFSKNFFENQSLIKIGFDSSGSNNLKDTNNLRSRIVNNLSFEGLDFILKSGVKNNLGIHFKNLNTVAKNDTQYKSSPQVELMSIFEASTSLPLIKYGQKYDSTITPKISLRLNPGDMKDYSGSSRKVSASNIFGINRLGLTDTFEEGKSLTMGFDYKVENIKDINKYFEFKIASVLRGNDNQNIPTSSSIKESGNIIGLVKNNISKNLEFVYDFSIDNNLQTIEYNSLSANFSLDKFTTGLKFIEENGKIGDANSIENSFTYEFDENNFLSFNTRRNRKISLTEFYDLIYEYKNDCLTAGIKYKKTYYKDRDLLPSENFMISLSIFPLTTYEKSFDRN
tara:strand:- start:961 stop:3576 length:2616 start_codon:yes stop_codon:yes gene_type:complete